MDLIKKFLDDTILDTNYSYERVDSLAEFYVSGDETPIATVEYEKSYGSYKVHFRMGLNLQIVGHLTMNMTLADSSLHFAEDFFIHEEYGYLYGDEARQAFINRLKDNIQAQQEQENGAFFVSHDPIMGFGEDTRTKYEKMWDEE